VWTTLTEGAQGVGGEPLIPHVWQFTAGVWPFSTGRFRERVVYPVGDTPWSVAMGDLEGDGDLDLVVVNRLDNDVGVLLNEGDGTFAPQVTYPLGDRPGLVAVGDLDGDGDLDLAVSETLDDTVSVLLNQGDGAFSPRMIYAVGYHPSWVSVGDLDGDGNLDLVTTNPIWSTPSLCCSTWGTGLLLHT
jgi:hypothetical protein